MIDKACVEGDHQASLKLQDLAQKPSGRSHGLPLLPGSRLGILGGGQLGRLLAMAAASLGLKTHVFCPEKDSPAFDVSSMKSCASYDDWGQLRAFAQQVDCVTYETENIPLSTVGCLVSSVDIYPPLHALEVMQDRIKERVFLTNIGLKVAPYRVLNRENWQEVSRDFSYPAFIKTPRGGYDGKGQISLATYPQEGSEAWYQIESLWELGYHALLLEEKIHFSAECSVIIARNRSGEISAYDIGRNEHEGQILRRTYVPSGLPDDILVEAVRIAEKICDSCQYVGILGVEMFYVAGPDKGLLINELAPRVHNSGHWTAHAAITSQFEQHIRAIAGWPLASPQRLSDVRMDNIIGDEAGDWQNYVAYKKAQLCLYGKREQRAQRKMGHIVCFKD